MLLGLTAVALAAVSAAAVYVVALDRAARDVRGSKTVVVSWPTYGPADSATQRG